MSLLALKFIAAGFIAVLLLLAAMIAGEVCAWLRGRRKLKSAPAVSGKKGEDR